jgi:DNA replication protein DnaC
MHRLGKQYTWELFDKARQPEAARFIDHIMKTWEAGLYLEGPSRTGKTHAAKAIVYERIRQHKTADFIHAAYLSRLFSQSKGFDESAHHAREEVARLLGRSLVAMDDLGSQKDSGSGVFEEGLQLFLDGYKGVLVVTTNLDPKGLVRNIGEKNARRIGERCAEVIFGRSGRSEDSITAAVKANMVVAHA